MEDMQQTSIYDDKNAGLVKSAPVILVVPPFFPCQISSAAAGILKTSLMQIDIPCKVFYANILFANMIGLEYYTKIIVNSYCNRTDLLGERVFAASAHDMKRKTTLPFNDLPPYLKEFYDLNDEVKEPLSLSEYSEIEKKCASFIKRAVSEMSSLKPRIIGFSCSLQQINSSVALAREIKKILPDVICVIGGKNCDGKMGEEIASSIKTFDFVFQGEADFAFSSFCRNYLKDNSLPRERLIRCEMPLDLDEVPSPDFTDYVDQALPETRKFACLTFESSRGCWWGQVNRCRFCADTGASITYRTKSPDRVVRELCSMKKKYPEFNNYLATDSIFPKSYFNDFFLKLSESGFRGDIAYEVKANLTFDQLFTMKKAGISIIDPGIESLSTRLLGLMNKGCTAASNIRLLRDCRELNITPCWHLLVCIPGDKVVDYEEQIRLMPLINHLYPPTLSPIIIQRFSPYFENREVYGLTDIRPVKGYVYAFPESVDISRLGYYFDARFPSEGLERPDIIESLTKVLIKWMKSWKDGHNPGLWISHTGHNQWTITDTREGVSQRVTVLDDAGYSLLRKYRIPRYRNPASDNGLIKSLLELNCLIEVDGNLLSVVCDLGMPEQSLL